MRAPKLLQPIPTTDTCSEPMLRRSTCAYPAARTEHRLSLTIAPYLISARHVVGTCACDSVVRQFAHPGACRCRQAGAFDAGGDVTGVVRLTGSQPRRRIREKAAHLQSDSIPAANTCRTFGERSTECNSARKLARRVRQMPHCALIAEWLAFRRSNVTALANSRVTERGGAGCISPETDITGLHEVRSARSVADGGRFPEVTAYRRKNEIRL